MKLLILSLALHSGAFSLMAADKDKEMSDSKMQNRVQSFCLQSSCHYLLTALHAPFGSRKLAME